MKKLFLLTLLFAGCIETDLQEPLEESLRVVLSGESFRVGGTYELQSEFLNMDGVVEEVETTWTSSDPNTFSINGNMGMGIAEGSVILTASARGIEATQEIEIEPSKASLKITMFPNTLQVGSDFAMGVNYIDLNGNAATTEVTWTSSNPAVASISPAGVVTGLTTGTTTIRAATSLLFDEITLNVINGPVLVDPEVRFIQFVEELSVDETFTFEAAYFGTDGMHDQSQNISWTSSNTDILAIDASGLARGVTEGMVTIEASSNGINVQLDVMVTPVEVKIRLGSLRGTGYSISGDFSMELNEDDDLILTITSYNADGPGPYFYLTNQTSNVSNGLNLGAASANGMYVINVSEIARRQGVEVNLFTYNILMVWCEPFGVRLGLGEFAD